MNAITISQLAREARVRVETIRYYERLGLLRQPQRGENGYRLYKATDTAQLLFIRNLQSFGFTLREIKLLIELRLRKERCCKHIRALTSNKLDDVRRKILQLKVIESKLHYYNNACDDPRYDGLCPLFADLWPDVRESDDNTDDKRIFLTD